MSLESATYISQLIPSNPPASDPRGQGDDHLRLIKSALQTTFPNASRAWYMPSVIAAKVTGYTIAAPGDSGKLIPCDTTSGAFTINLPSTGLYDGLEVSIMKTSWDTNAVTVSGNGKTINGKTSQLLEKGYQRINLIYSITLTAWLAEMDQPIKTGSFLHSAAASVSDYVICDGATTVGDASSGATVAGAHLQALFYHLYSTYTGAAALAVSGGRGANVAADWAAHKQITMPDLRGRALFGRDNMNTAANRITTALCAVDGTLVGASGGASTTTMARSDMPNVTCTVSATGSGTTGAGGAHTHNMFGSTQASSAGLSSANDNVAQNAPLGGAANAYALGISPSGSATLGKVSDALDHTHSFSVTVSGTTSSLNGNVTQTAMKTISPAFITNIFMAM